MDYMQFKRKEINYLLKTPEFMLGERDVKTEEDKLEECDFEYMAEVAFIHRLLSPFYKVYQRFFNEATMTYCEKKLEQRKSKKVAQLAQLRIIKRHFQQENIDFVLIKGFALSQLLFGDFYSRDFGDIDLLIDIESYEKADNIMKRLGFVSNLNNGKIPELIKIDCYEIEYFYEFEPGRKLCVELKMVTSSIRDMDTIAEIKKDRISINLDGEEYETINLSNTFILLCVNTYANIELEFGEGKMRDFVDIYFFLKKYTLELDWDYIEAFCQSHKMTHKMYAVLAEINKIYDEYVPTYIMNRFLISNITYDKSEFNNYEHGWMRDWGVDIIETILNRKSHLKEMFYLHALKSYTSSNKKYNDKILVEPLNDDVKNTSSFIQLQGLKSDMNEINHLYGFAHDREKIYFSLKFTEFNEANNMKTVLVLFDIDRKEPRKMVEFYYDPGFVKNNFHSKVILSDMKCDEVYSKGNEVVISMDKENFNVLKDGGKILCYRMYTVRRYNNFIDFAVKDDLDMFDFENVNVLYFEN